MTGIKYYLYIENTMTNKLAMCLVDSDLAHITAFGQWQLLWQESVMLHSERHITHYWVSFSTGDCKPASLFVTYLILRPHQHSCNLIQLLVTSSRSRCAVCPHCPMASLSLNTLISFTLPLVHLAKQVREWKLDQGVYSLHFCVLVGDKWKVPQ